MASSPVARLQQLIVQPSAYSAEELDELRQLGIHCLHLPNQHIAAMQIRSSVEIVDAIRRFDKASADLVAATNRLTRWILGLTVAAVLIGVAGVIATAWPYLVWWVQHGFRFR